MSGEDALVARVVNNKWIFWFDTHSRSTRKTNNISHKTSIILRPFGQRILTFFFMFNYYLHYVDSLSLRMYPSWPWHLGSKDRDVGNDFGKKQNH